MNWILTKDGSYTLRHDECGETYHNMSGAWSEALHVFVKPILQHWDEQGWPDEPIQVLDVGFGLGLNWLCLMDALQKRDKKVRIISLELEKKVLDWDYPMACLNLSSDLVAGFLNLKKEQNQFTETSEATLILGDALETLTHLLSQGFRCHAVMQDPFSPTKNPLCWSETYFLLLSQCCHFGAVVATYSVAGLVRRNLQNAGFTVRKTPGFGSKREQLFALKIK